MGLNYRNLHKAKAVKDNEFFTLAVDIQKELQHYWKHFKNKIILLNCNDNEDSEFWKYFKALFNVIKLKKLVAISYGPYAKVFIYDGVNIKTKKLLWYGDFDTAEAIQYLLQADIVVTNPPFSLLQNYIDQLIMFNKKFLIIIPFNSVSYLNIFKLFVKKKIWLGVTRSSMCFNIGNDNIKAVFTTWITNLNHNYIPPPLLLTKKYDPKKYPKYVNYNAINVDKIKDIPKDYYGLMGVPVTFLLKWNPDQFNILTGLYSDNYEKTNISMCVLKTNKSTIDGKGTLFLRYEDTDMKKPPAYKNYNTGELYQSLYMRIIIKNKFI